MISGMLDNQLRATLLCNMPPEQTACFPYYITLFQPNINIKICKKCRFFHPSNYVAPSNQKCYACCKAGSVYSATRINIFFNLHLNKMKNWLYQSFTYVCVIQCTCILLLFFISFMLITHLIRWQKRTLYQFISSHYTSHNRIMINH